MLRKISVAAMLVFATLITVQAQTTQKFTASKINEYGLVYTLPNTVVDVTIEVERTEYAPGEYYLYAEKYLDLKPVTERRAEYEIKSVIPVTRGVAVDSCRYLVQFKSGSTPYMMLNASMIPLAINVEDVPSAGDVSLPKSVDAAPTILQTPYARQAMTSEMIQASSTAKAAELAAARIYELRQTRSDIISGNADQMPADGQAMKLVLENLEKQEEALVAMFVGTISKSTQVRTYTYTPGTDDETIVIARVSALDGLVDSDNLAGEPVYMSMKVTERGTLPKNEKGEVKRFPKGGLAYRIPGQASIKVYSADKEYAEFDCPLAQLGVVFGLDPGLFSDKKAPAYAVFSETTGAVVTIGTR
ncbi:MAG: DUF4831 family protein [Paramuribaculum sp.]|nr:DUF4831 family protein [Paramuribaculum sp.]